MAPTMPPPPKLSVKEATDYLTSTVPTWELDTFTWKCLDGRTATVKAWKNAPPTLRELWTSCSSLHADKTFMVQYDQQGRKQESVTYSEAAARVDALGAWLHGLGLQKGDRVAIGARNFVEWPVCYFGVASAGFVLSALNAWFTAPELDFVIRDSDPAVLVLDGERFVRLQENGVLDAIVRDLRSTLKKLLLIRAEGVKGAEKYGDLVVHWNSMMRENLGKKMPVVDLQPDDPSSLYYSSGTTGKPKGCLAPHRSWTNIQISSPFGGSRQIVRRGDPFPPPANPNLPQRCSLIAMPMYHGFGTVVTTQMVMQGGKCVYMWKFDAGLALKMIQDEKITALSGVPSMVTQVLEHPDLEKYDISSLEAVTSGGAPAAASLGDDIKKKVKVPVVGGNGFGLTELNSCIVNLMDDFQRYPASIGLPTPVCEAKIMSVDGTHEMPTGQVGELWLRSSHQILGYWRRNDANAEAFSDDGYYKTGDAAYMNEEGFIFLTDRYKNVIIRGGENVYSMEVENALYEHPAVMEAAVIGIPDRVLGELVGAVVISKPGQKVTMNELIEHCKARIGAFKVPVFIDVRSPVPVPGNVDAYEGLPKNATGKVLKKDMKKDLEAKYVKYLSSKGSKA